MTPQAFHSLFTILKPMLQPSRQSRPDDFISPRQKLAITLEYFASGDLQRHTASCYRISKQHFGTIIDLVCNAICTLLSSVPKIDKNLFVEVANGFNEKWNFPNCIGAIDGKHVEIIAPTNSGSIFHNYKGYHSIVILAICDASFRFIYLNVGAYGSEGDMNIFRSSTLGQNTINDRQDYPENSSVNGVKLPFFYVGDDAFPLCKRILKPYYGKKLNDEEKIFNYRLSRARRCIENAFGILTWRWLCLKKTLFCKPDRAQKIISACCMLHNFLLSCCQSTHCSDSDLIDSEGNIIEGEWRKEINNIESSLFHTSLPPNLGRATDYGKYLQNKIKEYVNSPAGAVAWQRRAAFVE